jgi:hypothetical protein
LNKERLLKLAEFLEQLPSEDFNFNSFVEEYDVQNECGSVCCAIGWMPHVFPDLCKWVKHTSFLCIVEVESKKGKLAFEAAEEIFDIDGDASYYLFCPKPYDDNSDNRLPETASAVDVANRIREFVEQEGNI